MKLWVSAALLMVLATASYVLVPDNWLLPWGWPVGRYLEHANRVAFRLLLNASILVALIATFRAIITASSHR